MAFAVAFAPAGGPNGANGVGSVFHLRSARALRQADRMLDMGFEPQIRKILMQIPRPKSEGRASARSVPHQVWRSPNWIAAGLDPNPRFTELRVLDSYRQVFMMERREAWRSDAGTEVRGPRARSDEPSPWSVWVGAMFTTGLTCWTDS